MSNLLSALGARPAAALLVTPFVHLFTATTGTITPNSLPADFTEATFTGYAATALALPLLGPINVDSTHLGAHNSVNFVAGAIVGGGQNILGYWIDEAAAGGVALYMAEVFQTPVPIASIGDFIDLDVIFPSMLQAQLSF